MHHRLDVWRRSIEFAESVYKITGSFPKNEEYGLGSQLRRAAISIPSNQFLYIASGSASEIDTQLNLAHRLGYLSGETKSSLDRELEVISKMISSLIRSQK